MQIICDTREHASEWKRIERQFNLLGVSYFRSKLYVGDYQSLDNARLVVDRKKDLLEICGNVCQQHERFRAELVRAKEQGIRIVILCEHGKEITCLEDVYFWHNPRLDKWEIQMVNGKPKRVQKYPRATTGYSLYRSMKTMESEYGVTWEFCTKANTGRRIVEILGGDYGK